MARLVRKTACAKRHLLRPRQRDAAAPASSATVGFDPGYVRQYEEYYAALDPWHKHGQGAALGRSGGASHASMLPDEHTN